jgi:pSer/pThr/pTyr-binding forkhead associated (FHA) protein
VVSLCAERVCIAGQILEAFVLIAVNPTRGAVREFKLNKLECSVGTEASNDLIISDGSVSRRHATIRRHWRRWQVVDQKSTNGTYVGNCKAIGWTTIRDGQEVRFGAARFIFRAAVSPARADDGEGQAHRVRTSGLRLFITLTLFALVVGFAATQYFIYRSYQRQEASLHHSLPK